MLDDFDFDHLPYTSMTKEQKQEAEADSKTLNERVDKVLAKRSKTNNVLKPAASRPWKKDAHRQVRPRGAYRQPVPGKAKAQGDISI